MRFPREEAAEPVRGGVFPAASSLAADGCSAGSSGVALASSSEKDARGLASGPRLPGLSASGAVSHGRVAQSIDTQAEVQAVRQNRGAHFHMLSNRAGRQFPDAMR